VCTTEESKNLSTLTVEEVVGSLEAHEQQKKKAEPLDQLLQMKERLRTLKV